MQRYTRSIPATLFNADRSKTANAETALIILKSNEFPDRARGMTA